MTFASSTLNQEITVITLLTHGCPFGSSVTLSVRFSSQQVSGIISSGNRAPLTG